MINIEMKREEEDWNDETRTAEKQRRAAATAGHLQEIGAVRRGQSTLW